MRVFIVHAHHEAASFNGAMIREATAALGAGGHEVVVSDLYGMEFDPVSDRRNLDTAPTLRSLDMTEFDGLMRRRPVA